MSFELTHNSFAPHTALIAISAEVHEKMPTGELTGNPVHKVEHFLLKLEGHDRDNCIIRLNELIAELKKKCQ